MQVGGNAQWRNDVWLLTGGYLYYSIRRHNVDNILARRGNPVVRHNHQWMLEAACKWQPNWPAGPGWLFATSVGSTGARASPAGSFFGFFPGQPTSAIATSRKKMS